MHQIWARRAVLRSLFEHDGCRGLRRVDPPCREPSIVAAPLEALSHSFMQPERPALCPELLLTRSTDFEATWEHCERQGGATGLAPPYWAATWPGGLALARHILDKPSLVKGRRVLDLGAGSGVCAIAAATCGASHVLAADIDPLACLAVAANAQHNGVEVATVCADLLGSAATAWDLILAADLWYERFLAQRVNAWLREQAAAGTEVLIGDVGRAYLQRGGLVELARYQMPANDGFEREALTVGVVYRFGFTRDLRRR